jgi:hypothetical protein
MNSVEYERVGWGQIGLQGGYTRGRLLYLFCMASGPQTTTTAYGSEVKTSPMGTPR